jgi:hypothetical protein
MDHCWVFASNDRSATPRNVEHGIVEIAVAAHERLVEQSAVEFRPLVIVGEAVLQLSMMSLPVTHKEIEVVKAGHRTFRLRHSRSRIVIGSRGQQPRRCQAHA